MARAVRESGTDRDLMLELVGALVREGVDPADAVRIASVVKTRVDNNNRGTSKIGIERSGGLARSLDRLASFVASATVALASIPVLVQLSSNGYSGTALAIVGVLVILGVVAVVRYRAVDATARRIELTTAQRRNEGLPEHDLAQFATVVGRLSGRQGLHPVD